MKRSKRIYLLLGILAVVCIATFAVKQVKEHKEKIKNSDEIILKIPSDSIRSLSWENETTKLAFHKDEKWLYDEDEAFPVDEEKINELLEVFQEFGVSFIIEEVEDFGQYGLDDPICTINLATGEKSYKIQLGDYSKMDSQRYVSIGDGNVYLVKNDPLEYYDAVLSDVIDHDKVPTFDDVTEIRFAGDESYNIIYEKDSDKTYHDEDVYFAQQNGIVLPLDTSRVEDYLSNMSGLNLTDYVTYNVTDEELQKYGLDQPELTVMVNYSLKNEEGEENPDTFIMNISRDPEEKKAAEKAAEKANKEDKEDNNSSEEEKITAYVRIGESPIVYQINSEEYKDLMAASYDDLRHQEVIWADFSDITKMDISLEGNDYTITSKKKGDERTYYYQEEELEIADFKKALEALKADSFTDEQPTQKEEINLTVHLDNKNFPEVKIKLYRYDGTHCLAVVDGKPVSLIKRSLAVDLIEAVNAIVLN